MSKPVVPGIQSARKLNKTILACPMEEKMSLAKDSENDKEQTERPHFKAFSSIKGDPCGQTVHVPIGIRWLCHRKDFLNVFELNLLRFPCAVL